MTDPGHDEPPPVLRTWNRVYAAVMAYLGVVILVMYTFSRLAIP